MGYTIPKRPILPLPQSLPAVLPQRIRVVFCNAATVEAVARGDKSCDGYVVVPIIEERVYECVA